MVSVNKRLVPHRHRLCLVVHQNLVPAAQDNRLVVSVAHLADTTCGRFVAEDQSFVNTESIGRGNEESFTLADECLVAPTVSFTRLYLQPVFAQMHRYWLERLKCRFGVRHRSPLG